MTFKDKIMIKKSIFTATQIVTLSLVALFIGCKKEEPEAMVLSRQFAPATVTGTNGETQVKIAWPASLFTVPASGVQYQVDVSKTNTFDAVAYTTNTQSLNVTLTDATLAIRQDYFARVKALAANGSNESNFVISTTAFRITGEQLLLAVPDGDIIDNKVIIRWKQNAPLTKLTFIPSAGNGSPFDVALTAADLSAQQKIVSGLIPSKAYTVEGYADTKYKGTTTFTTKAAIAGNIVDLRGISASRTSVLTDTLGVIPSGSVVLLKKGNVYVIAAGFSLTKSVTIQSGLDFGTTPPMISMVGNGASPAGSVSFNFGAGISIDSIVFKDITIKGNKVVGGESYNFDYVINSSAVGTTVGLVRYINCTVKKLRGMTRAQAGGAGTKITNLFISNCVIDSIREFSIGAASGGSAIANIRITNSTIARVRKFVDHRVAGNITTWMENCTFNEVVAGANPIANAILDFNGVVGGAVTIKNCIFGRTWDETTNGTGTLMYGMRAGGGTPTPNVVGSYSTNDLLQTSNPISGFIAYNGSSTALFTDPSPAAFNFKIKDAAFAGRNSAGDPRWRIN